MTSLTPKQAHIHSMLKNNLFFYAKNVLKIRDKDGMLSPLIFNKVQLYIDNLLNHDIKTKGMVRSLILKGRKQGCSTYTGGRYYHKATTQEGRNVFILSHDAKTTDTLFTMVKRFYENCPTPLQPVTNTKNKNQLVFGELDSSYTVGTAGNPNIGRGGTPLLFHGSEVGFWEKTEEIRSGILNSVPRSLRTEIILESTANGQTGMFYDMCMQALRNESEYRLIFIPWFWQEEYFANIPSTLDFHLTSEEDELKYLYKVTNEQLYWRRLKKAELGSDKLFKQEYPFNIMEAFQASGVSLIELEDILHCRKNQFKDDDEPLILGVDPAIKNDRCVIAYRRGRRIEKYTVFEKGIDPMSLVGILAKTIKEQGVDACFIDTGLGYGTISRLHELGFKDVVIGVNFGSSATNDKMYANKRAEMLDTLAQKITERSLDLPDDDILQADLRMVPMFKFTGSGKRLFPSKDTIRLNNNGRSHDITDAVALTYAFPVRNKKLIGLQYYGNTDMVADNRRPLKTLNRVRNMGNKTKTIVTYLGGHY